MPKNAYICTMPNPLLKGVALRKGSYWRKVYISLSNGKHRQAYFNLETSDIKIAELRNRELSLNEDKIKSGLEFVPTWRSHTGTFRFKSYEFGYLSKKFMKYKRGEGVTKGSLDFYRIAFDRLMDIQNYFDTSWKADLDMTRMSDEHIEDIKKYFMMRVDARENGIDDIKGLSRHTVQTSYRNLRTFFDWLVDKEIIKRTPKLVIQGVYKVEKKFFVEDEINLIYDFISKSKYHSFLIDVYRLYEETGLRLSEPYHAILDGNILTVGKTKGNSGRGRKVALESHNVVTLKKLKKTFPSQYISKTFHKIITELGIKNGRSFKNWRNTFIFKTQYLTSDPQLTTKIIGHSSNKVTEDYIGNFEPSDYERFYPSLKGLREQRQSIMDAIKSFELNPYKIEG